VVWGVSSLADGFWILSVVAVVLYVRMIVEIREEIRGE
jgi:hypothetical protein